MKIAIDSNDLPRETRLDTWRRMLCDTYMGIDCDLPEDFRSVVEGHAWGAHSLTRITSSPHAVERSATLIKRDGLDQIIFGVLLAGRAMIHQSGREIVLEQGAVMVSDSSRPFRTRVEASADIVWLNVPKKPIAERVRGIEDLVATSLWPTRPIAQTAIDLMAGFDAALTPELSAQGVERLTTRTLDLMAMTIASGGWRPTPSVHVMPRGSVL